MIIHRRQLITGLVSLIAAPAIVKRSSIMPVKALPIDNWWVEPLFQPGGFIIMKGYSNDQIVDKILDVSVDAQGMCLQLVSSGRVYLKGHLEINEHSSQSP